MGSEMCIRDSRYTGLEGQILHPNTVLGSAGAPLVPCSLDDVKISGTENSKPEEILTVDQKVEAPPVLADLDSEQQRAFEQMWEKLPAHMRKIKFGLEGAHWPVEDIKKLGELLCKYSHRFSKDKMDLGYCTVDPFKIELKPGTRPVSYTHLTLPTIYSV